MKALGFFETSEVIYPPNCINTAVRIPHFPTNQYHHVASSYNPNSVKKILVTPFLELLSSRPTNVTKKKAQVKVKQFLCRPEQALSVPEG
jgi:hypothetical protein